MPCGTFKQQTGYKKQSLVTLFDMTSEPWAVSITANLLSGHQVSGTFAGGQKAQLPSDESCGLEII